MTALEPYRTPGRQVEIVKVEECASCMVKNRKHEARLEWWNDKGKAYAGSMAMIVPGFVMSSIVVGVAKTGALGWPAFACALGFIIAAGIKTGNLLPD